MFSVRAELGLGNRFDGTLRRETDTPIRRRVEGAFKVGTEEARGYTR
ncbi:hypothetical protein CGRA01v4_12256 [Colletotrichum graminicola]|nr:hypothetical protein CGRA01v4_12256 [Colletotrichum graminicola]